jgi:hypothetical protein
MADQKVSLLPEPTEQSAASAPRPNFTHGAWVDVLGAAGERRKSRPSKTLLVGDESELARWIEEGLGWRIIIGHRSPCFRGEPPH